jgi:hypothetical protein
MKDATRQSKSAQLLSALSPFPLTRYCFESFIQWVCVNADGHLAEYDLIDAIEKNEIDKLRKCEKLLVSSRNILGLTEEAFRSAFGFSDDLLTSDAEKIHDILAEPLLVVDLRNHGFTEIKKLPRYIISSSEKKQNCDFMALRRDSTFAIELKTIRMENKPKPEPGKVLGNSAKPYWWGEMFRNNSVTKIEDKDQRVLSQFDSTCRHYGCNKKMLVLYTRRLGTSSLMTKDDYVEELKLLKAKYPDVDHFASKDYFGMVTVFPELNGT